MRNSDVKNVLLVWKVDDVYAVVDLKIEWTSESRHETLWIGYWWNPRMIHEIGN